MKELFSCRTFCNSKNRSRKARLPLVVTLMLLFVFCMTAISWASAEYDASDVDSPPKIVRQMPITYPALAKKNGITGKVIVRCLIGVSGKVEKSEVVESEPEGIFDESALSTLKHWQFRPGIKSGELVATWVKIPINYKE